MSDAVWYYGKDGRENLYESNGHLYLNGKAVYYVRNGWWYEHGSGKAAFHIKGKWVYSVSGEAAYWTN